MIRVYNQGTLDAKNVTITDYIPSQLILNDADWNDNTDGTASITLAGPIPAGQSISVDITFMVDINAVGAVTNLAEISNAEDTDGNTMGDVDSTPDNNPTNDGTPVDNAIDNPNDEDDHDLENY